MKIYIIGGGAIGLPLAVFLKNRGNEVTVVRTSMNGVRDSDVPVTVQFPEGSVKGSINTVSLENWKANSGVFVVTAKAFMNPVISDYMRDNNIKGSVVLMQNGLGVEESFLDNFFDNVFRVVLYFTSENLKNNTFNARTVSQSPIGLVKGKEGELESIIEYLDNDFLKLTRSQDIQKEVWRKASLNVAFNSICPLSCTDNGIFVRDERAFSIAECLIDECIEAAFLEGVVLDRADLINRLKIISESSSGTLISTLQDINNGNFTEMEYLNHSISKIIRKHRGSSAKLVVETLGWLVDMLSHQNKDQE